MSHLDDLFGGIDEFGDENAGNIPSDDDDNGAPRDEDPDNPAAGGGDDGDGDGKPVKLETKKKTVRNPRNLLNIQRLCGPRGIIDMENFFKGVKYRGKGHESADLDAIMKRLEHWSHRMYPKYKLDDSLTTIERLGRKKQMQSYMNKYRLGMLESELVAEQDDGDDDRLAYESNGMNQPLDPLDSMLEEQIAISRAGNLNTSGIANLSVSERNFDSLRDDSMCSPVPAAASTSQAPPSQGLSEEMRAKIAANRLKALEIRKAKMAAASDAVAVPDVPVEEASNDDAE